MIVRRRGVGAVAEPQIPVLMADGSVLMIDASDELPPGSSYLSDVQRGTNSISQWILPAGIGLLAVLLIMGASKR